MPDETLDELLEKVAALKNAEAATLARKVHRLWQEGVVPNRDSIKKLKKFLEVDGPCARLGESGLCNGWLRKNAESLDFPVYAPYKCPFVDMAGGPKWRDCPGYRNIK